MLRRKIVILDGAMGTSLLARGHKGALELLNVEAEADVVALHEEYLKAGADIITVHKEACGDNLINVLKQIKSLGVKCGAVINPDTSVDSIRDAIEYCDMILLMSVFPGFGGQKFIPEVLPKIEQVATHIAKLGLDIDVEIDGGITKENVKSVKDAGANVIVAGSTVFNEKDRAKIIEELRTI